MANGTNPLVGRSVGHERAVFMATSGHFCWPPMGSSQRPLTDGLAAANAVTAASDGERNDASASNSDAAGETISSANLSRLREENASSMLVAFSITSRD